MTLPSSRRRENLLYSIRIRAGPYSVHQSAPDRPAVAYASYSRATSKLIDRPEESRPGDKEWELSFRNYPSKASHRSAKRKLSPKEIS